MVATNKGDEALFAGSSDFYLLDKDLVELLLLLPRHQAAKLEQAAHEHRLTVGQLVRRLIQDFTDRRRLNLTDPF